MNVVVVALIEAGFILAVGYLVYRFLLRPNLLRHVRAESELSMKQAEIEGREAALRIRETAEEELRTKYQELAQKEERLIVRSEQLEKERSALESDLQAWENRIADLKKQESELKESLARAAGLQPEEIRAEYLREHAEALKQEAKAETEAYEEELLGSVNQRVHDLMLDAMQRNATEYITEASLSVVELPSEDMKGRIIGREGRNIRAFEQVTGTDLIVDETPGAVVISCFNPIRRETARVALVELMKDSRIHPTRIEEAYEKAKEVVEAEIREAGQAALDRAGVKGVNHKIADTLGRLRFRASYGQNVLDHSIEVAHIASTIAHELGMDVEVCKRAGLLHDIGKALDAEGPHALTGMEFLKESGETPAVLLPVGAHHYDIEPTSPEAKVVIIADTISASRLGARRESLDAYMQRLTKLEEIAKGYPGVESCFAVQAGREVRLLVKPEEIDDTAAKQLAKDVAKRIEREVEGPGQIKVTVIRETRYTETSK